MGGGLIQLIAVGIQDIYLIGNPQITYFKTIYKKHTNFALECIPQSIDGRTDFGQTIEVTIKRKGDLIKDIIFEILLPALPTGYYWTNGIGNVILKQIDLEIGGQLIDRHYSEWLDIWSQLTINESKIGAYNAMVGNFNAISSQEASAVSPNRLQVPMFFWFNREWAHALPLIALQYHDIKLKVYLRDFASCYRNNTLTALPLTGYSIQAMNVWVDYIYLDMDERRKYAEKSHEYLIDQVQFSGDNPVQSQSSGISVKLNFNHPVKELYWVNSRNDYLQSNYLTGNQQLNYTLDPSLPETFNTGLIQLNGIDRFQTRSANYFRLVQNYQFHTRYSLKNIYTYSFGLFPEKYQPSGTCNMSKITSVNLYLDYSGINNTGPNQILKVFAVNYNIFRIMSGMGGLSFSN
jgi:hypothetical protein